MNLIVNFKIYLIFISNIKYLKSNIKMGRQTTRRKPGDLPFYIEYQTFGKKGLGMGNSVLFSHDY